MTSADIMAKISRPLSGAARSINVVVVCPWFFRGDAVGAAARDTYLALKARENLNVTALWTVNDYDDVHGRQLGGLADLLLDPDFTRADVLIYIFAVYHEMFDAVILGNGHARQIVRFHNVTPKALMPEKHWPVIERSFVQMQNFRFADEIWADSRENFEELERQNLGGPHVRIEPLAVRFPARSHLSDKPTDIIQMMFVGRFFEYKGALDVVEAVDRLRARSIVPFKLTLAGNIRFSDSDYVKKLNKIINERNLHKWICFEGSVSPERLSDLYSKSHIFVTGSRHEGFCVPVIEALAAGCIPVSYSLSNLRFIAGGLTRLSSTPTPRGLAQALERVISALHQGQALPLNAGPMAIDEFDSLSTIYVEQFRPESFAIRIGDRVEYLASSNAEGVDPH